jgi:hypothetical protein
LQIQTGILHLQFTFQLGLLNKAFRKDWTWPQSSLPVYAFHPMPGA